MHGRRRYELLFNEMSELATDPEALVSTFVADEDELAFPSQLEPGDLGVSKWAQWDLQRLCNHLGFLAGRPALFAEWRSRSGMEVYLEDVQEDDREEFALLWHQAVAIAAMSEGFWTPKTEPDGVPGMLLADTVGLGKTVEMMGLMAMIIQTRQAERQEAGVRANIISESISHTCAIFLALHGCPTEARTVRGLAVDVVVSQEPPQAVSERAGFAREHSPNAYSPHARGAAVLLRAVKGRWQGPRRPICDHRARLPCRPVGVGAQEFHRRQQARGLHLPHRRH